MTLNDAIQFWPTPQNADGERASLTFYRGEGNPTLLGVASLWPTPRVMPGNVSKVGGKEYETSLPSMARKGLLNRYSMWPTPNAGACNYDESPETWTARAEELKAKGINGNGAGLPLGVAAQMWGTPRVTDNGGLGYPRRDPRAGLEDQAAMWATPTSRDHKDGDCREANVPTNGLLGRQATRHDPTMPKAGDAGSRRAVLSPQFVEMLLGLPSGWTDCETALTDSEPVGTLSSLLKPPMRSASCGVGFTEQASDG